MLNTPLVSIIRFNSISLICELQSLCHLYSCTSITCNSIYLSCEVQYLYPVNFNISILLISISLSSAVQYLYIVKIPYVYPVFELYYLNLVYFLISSCTSMSFVLHYLFAVCFDISIIYTLAYTSISCTSLYLSYLLQYLWISISLYRVVRYLYTVVI